MFDLKAEGRSHHTHSFSSRLRFLNYSAAEPSLTKDFFIPQRFLERLNAASVPNKRLEPDERERNLSYS